MATFDDMMSRYRPRARDSHEYDLAQYQQQQLALGNDPGTSNSIGDQYTHKLGTNMPFDASVLDNPAHYQETRGMSPEQFARSPYSSWQMQPDGTMTYTGRAPKNPTWIDQGGAGNSSLGYALKRVAPYAAATLGIGAALGGLSSIGVPGLFGGESAVPAAGAGESAFGSYLNPTTAGGEIWGDGMNALTGSFSDPVELERMTSAIGEDWLTNVQNIAQEEAVAGADSLYEGAQTTFDDFGLADPYSAAEIPEVYEPGSPNLKTPPTAGGSDSYRLLPGMPSKGPGAMDEGVGTAEMRDQMMKQPGLLDGIAKSLGLTTEQLGKLIAAGGGAIGSVISGNRTQNLGREQLEMGAPSRARFEQMSQNPGQWAKTNINSLVDSAADRLGRKWSMFVGNPAESPYARISTERDLAQLMFEAEMAEKAQQAQAGGLTRFDPAAGFNTVLGGQQEQSRGVTGAIGSVLDTIFGTKRLSSNDQLLSMLSQYLPYLTRS